MNSQAIKNNKMIRLIKKEKLELNFKNIEKTLKKNRSIKKLE